MNSNASRIVLDVRTWPWTGIGRVTRGIYQCARELESEFEIHYIVNDEVPLPDQPARLHHFRSKPFGRGEQTEFRRLFKQLGDGPVLLHSLNFNVPLLLPRHVRQLVHFYDVLSDTGEFRTVFHRMAYQAYVWSLRLHKATTLAQSAYTEAQIRKHHPFHEVIVCPHGFRNYMKAQPADLQGAYGLTRPYFLYIGLNKPRKNLDGLLSAYSKALSQQPDLAYDLVVCGPIFDRTALGFDIRAAVEADPLLRQRVHLLGFIPEEHLHAIYSQASLYVVPSHLESGFSYPALEALTTGTPVLLNKVDMSNYASAAPGVYFFDGQAPDQPEGLDQVLLRMLGRDDLGRVDPSTCDVLARFTWDRVKAVLREQYQRA